MENSHVNMRRSAARTVFAILAILIIALTSAGLVASDALAAAPTNAPALPPAAPSVGCIPFGFGPVTTFGVGTAPWSVAVADFNKDGNPDLVTANEGTSSVSVLLGNGAGSFGAATNFVVGALPFSVAVGDVNRDGNPDIATANSLSNTVSILLGTGTGGFGAATSFAVGTTPYSVAVADFNRDGNPDLAA